MTRLNRRKKQLLALFGGAIVIVPVIVSSTNVKRVFKTQGPLSGIYLRYSKWRYNWRGPSDMGEGRNATQIIIEGPMGIAENRSGILYVSDRDARFVWKIEPSGRATVIAGTGMVTGLDGLPRERVFARDVNFASPEGLTVDRDENILLADSLNHAIVKIDRQGYMTIFAGNMSRGYDGDGKPATELSLANPYDVRVDSKGNVYIADTLNHRIRKVGLDGVMTTVAGIGRPGYSGDGGPAVAAQLDTPYGILLDRSDNLLIADSNNHVIRKVGPDGIIHTIAGTRVAGYSGDGRPALEAKFDSPQSMAIDPQGRLYIDDEHNHAIRILEPDGTVRTLVGSRGPGFSGDGGPASAAQIADPENVWILSNGSILISARDNARVRIVYPNGIISTFAGKGPTDQHDYYSPIRLPPVTL